MGAILGIVITICYVVGMILTGVCLGFGKDVDLFDILIESVLLAFWPITLAVYWIWAH